MKNGFTLIEVVITIAIFALIMTATTTLYVFYTKAFGVEKASIDVGLGVSAIIDAERSATLQADHIVSSHTFSGTTYYSSATTTVFELPSVQSSGSIISNSYDYIAIYASGTNVYSIADIAAGSSRPTATHKLTSALGSLSIAYDNGTYSSVTSITVNATTTETARNGSATSHLSEHIYLRN